MAENETQEVKEEVTEAVETQSLVTDQANAQTAVATEEAKTEAAQEVTEETKPEPEEEEEISYHAVEKEGEITAIWEMQGRKHIRTISARSDEGEKILSLFTSELHETDAPPMV